jgi:phenylalanyl-tRNA synthetase beta chain
MPQSVLSWERVQSLLPAPLSEAHLESILFMSKAELSNREGDAITLEVTPDRLDLLSEGGLGLFLQGMTDVARGLPPVLESPRPGREISIEVDPSVEPLRPAIAGVVVTSPDESGLDAGTLTEAIRFQELLHATVGGDRRAASLGIYPIDRLESPIRYSMEQIDSVRLVPLDQSEEIPASRFFADHPLARRYGALGREGDRCLSLRDALGTVLSLPPILNSRTGGQAQVGDPALLLESTGVRPRRVNESLGLLLLVFIARGWSVTAVPAKTAAGQSDGRQLLIPRSLHLPHAAVNAVAGPGLAASEIEHFLAQSRLTARAERGGWSVSVPSWRPDILTEVDLVEEVILAHGVRVEEGILPPSASRGHRREETRFQRRFNSTLLGLGYSLIHTTVLVSEAAVSLLGRTDSIALTNPVSENLSRLRDALQISLIETLARNLRNGYPQRFGEVGPVIQRDLQSESGAATRYHLGALLASETSGFADAAALVDYWLRSIDVSSVREPAELPGTLPGRAARVRVAGDSVAEIGEIHPRVLSELHIPVPATWAELDLTAVWPLVRRRITN